MLGDEVEVSIQASTDTFISAPVDGQTLVYSNTKWRNNAAGSGSTSRRQRIRQLQAISPSRPVPVQR